MQVDTLAYDSVVTAPAAYRPGISLSYLSSTWLFGPTMKPPEVL